MNIKNIFFLLVSIFFLAAGNGPYGEDMHSNHNLNYAQIFPGEYLKANDFIQRNIENDIFFLNNQISPHFAWSIVFPELMRYSSFSDKIELSSLYTLYVNFGEKYADFSVGPFQMKPSFVEQIEKDYLKNKNKIALTEEFKFDTNSSKAARINRIQRLENSRWQVCYLVLFIKLLDEKYSQIEWENPSEKLRFFASAYNCGYRHPYKNILSFEKTAKFHIGIIKTPVAQFYSYCSIAQYHFENEK